MNEKEVCAKCPRPAVWFYMPAGEDDEGRERCDEHVPRGCSCTEDEGLDERGRRAPCCEWMYFPPEDDAPRTDSPSTGEEK